MALLLTKKGRTDDAINKFRKALDLCPTDLDILLNLGIILISVNNED